MSDVVSTTHRSLLIVVGVLLVAALAGGAMLWPSAEDLPAGAPDLEDLISGEIVAFETLETDPDADDGLDAFGITGGRANIEVLVLEGVDEGELITLRDVPLDGYPDLAVGDRVKMDRTGVPGEDVQYFITDFERTPVLLILLGLFVAAVLLIGRWHGLRSLFGLILSLLIVVRFIVPALLAGSNPPLVALVGAVLVMIVTLYLSHGVNEMTTAAIVGTTGALILTVGLGLWFIDRAKITGYASDDALFASFAVQGLDLQGLVLAGLIIAALGVLDDVTVSQASTVFALHDTDRTLTWGPLFARAMKVGRDHIASVVNTLFLAYAGASLALLVLFSTGGVNNAEIFNSEVIAQELVKIIVGSLGLITAVPLTTALAAKVAVDRPDGAPAMAVGHSHGGGPRAAAADATVDANASDGDRAEAPPTIRLGMDSFHDRLERGAISPPERPATGSSVPDPDDPNGPVDPTS